MEMTSVFKTPIIKQNKIGIRWWKLVLEEVYSRQVQTTAVIVQIWSTVTDHSRCELR